MTRYIRRRYLALKVKYAKPLNSRAISDAVWSAILRLFGEVGCSQSGVFLIHFDENTNYAILRCSHKALPMVKAAIASITRIGDNPATIHVLRVSGTLKALRKVRDTTPGGFEYSSVITTEVG